MRGLRHRLQHGLWAEAADEAVVKMPKGRHRRGLAQAPRQIDGVLRRRNRRGAAGRQSYLLNAVTGIDAARQAPQPFIKQPRHVPRIGRRMCQCQRQGQHRIIRPRQRHIQTLRALAFIV